MEVMESVSWIAVVACAVSTALLGMVWYSPLLFHKVWAREAGITEEMARSISMPKAVGGTILLGAIAAFVLTTLIPHGAGVLHGISFGFRAGLFFVGAFTGINYIWSLRTFKMFLIDAGYHTVQFSIYGALIGWLQ